MPRIINNTKLRHDVNFDRDLYLVTPPIMPESLAGLDMPPIIGNAKLRHDVNFDQELHVVMHGELTCGEELLCADATSTFNLNTGG